MTITKRRTRLIAAWLAVLVVLLIPEVVLLRSALDARPQCKILGDWVARHQSLLPTSYADLLSYPLAYRRAIVPALPVAVRSNLWATQLEMLRRETPDLPDIQQERLSRLIAGLRAHEFGDPESAATKRLIADVAAFVELRPDLRKAFTQLGPDEGRYSWSILSAWANLGDAVRRSISANAQGYVNCNCNTGDDWCPNHYSGNGYAWCENPQSYYWVNCYPAGSGCGWFWWQPCNGLCAHCEIVNGEEFCGIM